MKIEYSREKMEELFLKGKKRIISLVLIVLTLMVVSSVYQNQSKKVESLRAAKEAELKKNEVLQGIGRSEKTLKLYNNLLGKKDPYLVMNALTDIANDSGVVLVSVKPGTEIKQPLYIKQPFNLVASAESYHAIGKFISSIENHPDIFFIDAVIIRAQENRQTRESEAGQASKPAEKLNINLSLSTIVFKN